MSVQFKTASFGGYDKKAVDDYIITITEAHNTEVADLKANVLKLSETVKNLHTMREVNLNESTSTIDNLKNVNDALQVEVTQLKEELEAFRNKEYESASRYESISRTLLEARESADELLHETEMKCQDKVTKTQAECDALTEETTTKCTNMFNETTAECQRMETETTNACQEMRESTYADCEKLKKETVEETDKLKAETEYNCKILTEQTVEECEDMRNQARIEAYNTRMTVKRECESVSDYMAQLIHAVDNVVTACDETKAIADQAFPELSK